MDQTLRKTSGGESKLLSTRADASATFAPICPRCRAKEDHLTQAPTDAVAMATARHLVALARRTVEETIAFSREHERRVDDPLLLREVADLEVKLHAAEAVLLRATRLAADPNAEAAASTMAAEAEVLATEIALASGARFSELSGRPAPPGAIEPGERRTPLRWQIHAIGNLVVNGVALPRLGRD